MTDFNNKTIYNIPAQKKNNKQKFYIFNKINEKKLLYRTIVTTYKARLLGRKRRKHTLHHWL